ncbi:hypothetical protein V2J09_006594 [Rumex salicifolius]
MVKGHPSMADEGREEVCTVCQVGKQHRRSFPKKSLWQATSKQQLGGEFLSTEFKQFCDDAGIRRQLTTTLTPHGYQTSKQILPAIFPYSVVMEPEIAELDASPQQNQGVVAKLESDFGRMSSRVRSRPGWHDDYKVGNIVHILDDEYALQVGNADPTRFEEAVQSEK